MEGFTGDTKVKTEWGDVNMIGLLQMDLQGCFMPQVCALDDEGQPIMSDLEQAWCKDATTGLIAVHVRATDSPTLQDHYHCTPGCVWVVEGRDIHACDLDGVVTQDGFQFHTEALPPDTTTKIYTIEVDDAEVFLLANRLCDYQAVIRP